MIFSSEKIIGFRWLSTTENGYQVKMKKAQEFEVAVPEQEERWSSVCTVSD